MAREVTHNARGPAVLDATDLHPTKDDIAVCRCGLSDDPPLCDGSHRATEDETPGLRYRYVDGERRVIERVEYAEES